MRTTSEGDRIPLVIAARVPGLALRIGVGFLRFLGKRRTGVRAFRHALLAGGMSREQADRLAQQYHEAGSVPQILRRAGVMGAR